MVDDKDKNISPEEKLINQNDSDKKAFENAVLYGDMNLLKTYVAEKQAELNAEYDSKNTPIWERKSYELNLVGLDLDGEDILTKRKNRGIEVKGQENIVIIENLDATGAHFNASHIKNVTFINFKLDGADFSSVKADVDGDNVAEKYSTIIDGVTFGSGSGRYANFDGVVVENKIVEEKVLAKDEVKNSKNPSFEIGGKGDVDFSGSIWTDIKGGKNIIVHDNFDVNLTSASFGVTKTYREVIEIAGKKEYLDRTVQGVSFGDIPESEHYKLNEDQVTKTNIVDDKVFNSIVRGHIPKDEVGRNDTFIDAQKSYIKNFSPSFLEALIEDRGSLEIKYNPVQNTPPINASASVDDKLLSLATEAAEQLAKCSVYFEEVKKPGKVPEYDIVTEKGALSPLAINEITEFLSFEQLSGIEVLVADLPADELNTGSGSSDKGGRKPRSTPGGGASHDECKLLKSGQKTSQAMRRGG